LDILEIVGGGNLFNQLFGERVARLVENDYFGVFYFVADGVTEQNHHDNRNDKYHRQRSPVAENMAKLLD
jgi:hypothetical protein